MLARFVRLAEGLGVEITKRKVRAGFVRMKG
jgi:hypothetical protein